MRGILNRCRHVWIGGGPKVVGHGYCNTPEHRADHGLPEPGRSRGTPGGPGRTRLRAAHGGPAEGRLPLIDAAVVEATVTAAYHWFREARVRAYVPILAERRARKALGAVRTDVEAGS